MGPIAIRAEGLSKSYRIQALGTARKRYRTLQEDILALPGRLATGLRGGEAVRRDIFWALDDVSLELPAGKVLGVIGRNGAGKSTLLKVLARITEPSRGRAELHGRVGSLLEVGTGFHPELTGRENVYLSGAILGMRKSEIANRFDEIVEFAAVSKFIDTPVKRYSSGMQLRLAFAVAAHLEANILLVDEVLAVGDAEFQKKSMGKMGEITRQGRTIVFVSHNLHAIEQFCDQVLLLEHGRALLHGTDVRSIITTYLSADTSSDAAAEWKNSGGEYSNPWFEPLRFALTDSNGTVVRSHVRSDEPIWFEVEGQVEELDPGLQVGMMVYSDDGVPLFCSYFTDVTPERWPRLEIGRNVLRLRIPDHTFNDGAYRIELAGGLHYRQWLFQPGESSPALHFEAHGAFNTSPYWVERRPGMMAPLWPWGRLP